MNYLHTRLVKSHNQEVYWVCKNVITKRMRWGYTAQEAQERLEAFEMRLEALTRPRPKLIFIKGDV